MTSTAPYDRVTLAAAVARLWPDAARAAGLDPAAGDARVATGAGLPAGVLWLWFPVRPPPRDVQGRAIDVLVRGLRTLGYVIERDGRGREIVVGVAAPHEAGSAA